ncbi:hypothetical protein SNEBB_002935 [Seison nebaliae]|nr:hypothetical protein SNEBB_002935 [Seison nebaliae]
MTNNEDKNGKHYLMEEQKTDLKTWFKLMYHSPIGSDDVKYLVLDYLVTGGYEEAARDFIEEAHITKKDLIEQAHMGHAKIRMKIKELIENGNIEEAMLLIDEEYDDILKKHPDVLFLVRLQQFLEYMRNGKEDDALEFATSSLSDCIEMNEDLEKKEEARIKMEKAMSLFVFDEPNTSMFSYLLSDEQRLKVSEEVNRCLLEADQLSPYSLLELYIYELTWMQQQLDKEKMLSYPKLVDINSANVALSKNGETIGTPIVPSHSNGNHPFNEEEGRLVISGTTSQHIVPRSPADPPLRNNTWSDNPSNLRTITGIYVDRY